MSHALSSKIKFEDISKELFSEHLDNIKVICLDTYNEESVDGFLDLYNYWEEKGVCRIKEKISRSLIKIECDNSELLTA